MTFEEYTKHLAILRATYAGKIRDIVQSNDDDYTIISRSEIACAEYRLTVDKLMALYNANKDHMFNNYAPKRAVNSKWITEWMMQ